MKKLKGVIFILLLCLNSLFANNELILTTYKNPNVTDLDVLDSFIYELNHLPNEYRIIDYEVFSKPDDQNYAWALYKDDSYSDIHLELLVDNGKFIVESTNRKNEYYHSKTFGSDIKAVSTYVAPSEINRKIKDFTEKCYELQKKNGRAYRGESLYMLYFLNYNDGYRLTSKIKRDDREYIKGTEKPINFTNKYPIQDLFVNDIFSMSKNKFSLVSKNCVLKSVNLYSPDNYNKMLTRFINVTYYDEKTNTESYYNEYEIFDNRTGDLSYSYEEAFGPLYESDSFSDNDKIRIRKFLGEDVYITGFIVDHNKIVEKENKKQQRKYFADLYLDSLYKHFINFGASFVPYPNTGYQLDVDYNYALGNITLGPGFSYNSQAFPYYEKDSYMQNSTDYTTLMFGVPIRYYFIPQDEEGFFLNIFAFPNAQLALIKDFNKKINDKKYGFGCEFRVEAGFSFTIMSLKAFVGYHISSNYDKGCVTIGLASGAMF